MRLARALGCGRATAVGHLELLFHFTAQRAPQGNVGKWGDQEIADGAAFDGDATTFITALVESGWLDRSPKHRLLVHDWHEHADNSVQKYIKRREDLPFLTRGRSRSSVVRTSPDISALARGKGKAMAKASEATPKPWRTLPAGETLTEARLAVGKRYGLPVDVVQREWAEFADHTFRSPRKHVDRTWENWCEKAAAWRPTPSGGGPRREPKHVSPTHAYGESLRRQNEEVERKREEFERSGGGDLVRGLFEKAQTA